MTNSGRHTAFTTTSYWRAARSPKMPMDNNTIPRTTAREVPFRSFLCLYIAKLHMAFPTCKFLPKKWKWGFKMRSHNEKFNYASTCLPVHPSPSPIPLSREGEADLRHCARPAGTQHLKELCWYTQWPTRSSHRLRRFARPELRFRQHA